MQNIASNLGYSPHLQKGTFDAHFQVPQRLIVFELAHKNC
jgi:hypothetical protein